VSSAAHFVLGVCAVILGWIAASGIDAALDPPTVAISGSVPVPVPVPVPSGSEAPDAEGNHKGADDALGTFRMTRYYVVDEKAYKRAPKRDAAADADPDADPVLASAAPAPARDGVTIYDDRTCRPIATLGWRFVEVLDVQGTGRLRDGRIVNVSRPCRCGHSPCYRVIDESARWGLSALSKPLQPFRTVAVDPKVIPLGSLLYIPELDGLTMPGQAPWGGFVHDGCVHAADVGGGIDGKHIDFFVGKFAHKRALDARRKMKRVTVYRGEDRCQREGGRVARKAGI